GSNSGSSSFLISGERASKNVNGESYAAAGARSRIQIDNLSKKRADSGTPGTVSTLRRRPSKRSAVSNEGPASPTRRSSFGASSVELTAGHFFVPRRNRRLSELLRQVPLPGKSTSSTGNIVDHSTSRTTERTSSSSAAGEVGTAPTSTAGGAGARASESRLSSSGAAMVPNNHQPNSASTSAEQSRQGFFCRWLNETDELPSIAPLSCLGPFPLHLRSEEQMEDLSSSATAPASSGFGDSFSLLIEQDSKFTSEDDNQHEPFSRTKRRGNQDEPGRSFNSNHEDLEQDKDTIDANQNEDHGHYHEGQVDHSKEDNLDVGEQDDGSLLDSNEATTANSG
ncbi:unnamed protein product, partial [Amoebophrya sp. A25]